MRAINMPIPGIVPLIGITAGSIVAGTEYSLFRSKKQTDNMERDMKKTFAEQEAKQDRIFAEQRAYQKNTATIYGEAGQKGKL